MSTDIQQAEETDMTHGHTTLRRQPRTHRVVLVVLALMASSPVAGYLLFQYLAG